MGDNDKEMTIEQSFARIEEIITQMEEGDVSLDKSFALYQEGIGQLKNCNELLDKVEKKLLILNGED
jgi:exodeoxyribonuclease VII small subunit